MADDIFSSGQLTGVVLPLLGLIFLGELAVLLWLARQIPRRRTAERLDELTERLRQIETRLDRIEGGPSSPTERTDPRVARIGLPGPGLHPPGPMLIAIPDMAMEAQPIEEDLATALGERHAEVWSLVGSGVPAEEIARRTNQPIGRVELIEGLYRRLHSPQGATNHAQSR
jgi:hypothetical protein